MDPIRVVLADDEPGMRLVVRKILEKSGGFEIMGEAENGKALLTLVEEMKPQLVLLDVEMPEMTGVEAARVIQDTDPQVMMIFTTAHEQYMADAFAVYAFDYLLKPFKVERALQTLERVKQALSRQDTEVRPLPQQPKRGGKGRLMLKHREGVNFIDMEDILLVQRENRSTVLYTVGEKSYTSGDALGEMESKLDPQMFFRCHKSYIINLNHIDSITPYGRWTYIVKLRGTKRDALITYEKFEELEKFFG